MMARSTLFVRQEFGSNACRYTATSLCAMAVLFYSCAANAQPSPSREPVVTDAPDNRSSANRGEAPAPADAAGTDASRIQQPRTQQAESRLAAARRRLSLARKQRTPSPLGDFMSNNGLILSGAYSGLPLAGGASRTKISDNSKALPQNRVYFLYYHFHNAIDTFAGTNPGSASIDRYDFGFEKTICNGHASLEIRMPFANEFDSGDLDFMGTTNSVSGGGVGNIAVTLKSVLCETDSSVFSAGLGVSAPTGSDVIGTDGPFPFRVENDAVYLLPFLGFMSTCDSRHFCHAFLQVDVPTHGNRLTELDSGASEKVRDQTLLYIDVAHGTWLYNCECPCGHVPGSRWLTGVAALIELHYATSLQNADVGTIAPEFVSDRVDILNLTAGIHLELAGRCAARVGGVIPIERSELTVDNGAGIVESRGPFDAEIQASLIFRF